ncbi:alpha/beta hydrolase [Candidatus Aminicenantes bacterium AH-873-B07]|jgi:4,5:9,10-diseco-3-hydroxy-5,9,17-trioxoandrosta-1(10),2-diene-4-oate hydrolase|nr:alpha/beta hydrolase [Candidatus Aminicenantes bacterium AH-873-B07]
MKEKFIKFREYSICVWETGDGPPVILLHGLGASKEWWKYNIQFLGRNFKVLVPDIIGFGNSEKPEINYDLSLANDFIKNIIEKFKLGKVALIGNSMGGLIALNFSADFPDKVQKITLVDNAGFSRELSFILRIATIYPVGEIALSFVSYKTIKILLKSIIYNEKKVPEELIYKVLEILKLPNAKSILLKILRYGVSLKGLNPLIYETILKKISKIEIPTLIIWGREDRIIPLSQAYLGQKLIKNSRLYIFERCGHLPQIEYSDEFNQLVLNFLLE